MSPDPVGPAVPPERWEFDPDWTIRPGKILAVEIKATGFRHPDAMSKISGLPHKVLGGVLDGSVEITQHIAEGLARIGGTAQLWLALEQNYRRDLAAGRRDVSDD